MTRHTPHRTEPATPLPRLTIAVTGATGTIGSRVAARLAPHHHVRAVTRDPEAAERRGVAGEKIRADFTDRRALRPVLAGADALLLITSDPLRPDHDETLLRTAREQGVRHVVKLSALAVTDPGAQDLITRWQRRCEALVRDSGLPWTLLRPRAFMSKALDWIPSVRAEGVVSAVYGTSRNSCIDPDDIAAAAARVLTTPGHAGRSYALTGPQALSAREQTDLLARRLHRPLRFQELTCDQAWELWRRRYPEPIARAIAESARRQQAGAKEHVTDGIRQLLGREPAPFTDWAARHAPRFR
ncbi:NAD(P)H-binding protein [Streptomyces sp. NPDC052309]|uniref:NAD(P)H-binding protein n=1 Tax=Streptomyces sp. NPDC052309 TaxID=3155421 RepID=UPI003446B6C9